MASGDAAPSPGPSPGAGKPSAGKKLFIPKKRVDNISDTSLAELRAEFGTPRRESVVLLSPPPEETPASWELCPFCDEPMPRPMSAKLTALVQHWVHKKKGGLALRPTDTIAVCQRHRDEHDIIPEGERRGWPLEIDFRELRRRITDPQKRYMRVLQDRLMEPEQSTFFQAARRTREHVGRKASASAHQIECFDERHELFADILYAAFVQDPLMPSLDLKNKAVLEKIQPLDAAQFLDEALLPELVCMLIQDDLGGEAKAAYDDAMRVQRDSRKFGVAMYPSDTSDARKTRRTSGGWLGPSPKRERRKSTSPPAKRRNTSDGYVQQTLFGLRRSSRIPVGGPRVMLDGPDSDEDEAQPMHQQRLHLSREPSSVQRPMPRPAGRKPSM